MPLCCCVSKNTKPLKMPPLRCVQTTANSVTLQWGAAHAQNVEVRCRPYKGAQDWMNVDSQTSQLVPLGTGKTSNAAMGSLLVGGLKEDQEYEFTCCAMNGTGHQGVYSDPIRVKTQAKPKKLPPLQIGSVTCNSVSLSWEQPSNLHSLLIKIRKKMVSTWLNVDAKTGQLVPCGEGAAPTAESCKVDVVNLEPSTEYEIIVHGGNNVGWGPASDLISFTTEEGSEQDDDMVKLSCTSTTRSTVQLSWAPIDAWCVGVRGRLKSTVIQNGKSVDNDDYWLQVDTFRNKLVPEREAWAAQASACGIPVKKLDDGETYEFAARILTSAGWGPWGEPIVVTTQLGMSPIRIGKITSTTVQFEWTVPESAVNVAIRCKQLKDDKWLHVDSRTNSLVPLGKGIAPRASDGAIILRGLTEETAYEVGACARTASGWGPYCQRVPFETPSTNVSVMRCLKASGNSLTLQLNVPSSTDGANNVAIRCRKEGESAWMDVDATSGKLVPRGTGTKCAEGTIVVEGLEEGARYEVETSRDE
ncbi:putative receptor-type tyrosine-protein phosphatase F-like, partial [Diplonema papillatum]